MTQGAVQSPAEIIVDLTEKRPIQVIHIDREAGLLKVAKQLLEMKGQFQVDTASSVEEAQEKMKKKTYDAVVCDYQMPGEDGLELLKDLRKNGNTIPFVIFTGKSREEIAIDALNLGADRLLSKTGDPETVCRELAHAINETVECNRAKEKMQQGEERFQLLFDNMAVGVVLVDRNGCIVAVNQAQCAFLGYGKEELTGMHFSEFLQGEDFDRNATILREMLEGKRDKYTIDRRYKRKDGALVWGRSSGSAVRSKEGHFKYLVAIVEDITEHKNDERIVLEGKQKFEGLFTGNPEATVYLDQSFHILDVNPRFTSLFGYSPEEVKGRVLNDIVVPESCIEEAHMLDSKAGEGYVYHDTVRAKKDGFLVHVSVSAAPIFIQNQLVGYIGVYKDISELKKTEKELQKAMENVGIMNEKLRVVGGLTRHDVRNKLSTIIGNTYLARKELAGNSKVADYFKEMETAVQQVVKIFDFAKTYEMLGVEGLAYVEVEKTINEAASLFSGLQGVRVANECHGLIVLADSLLRQLFYNLMDNSLKYGKQLTEIRIYYEKTEEYKLRLICEDNGVGIRDSEKSKLFKEGYSSGGSTGYGLYLIKKMMEFYGWTIQETGTFGKGAQFTIAIPKKNQNGKENYRLPDADSKRG